MVIVEVGETSGKEKSTLRDRFGDKQETTQPAKIVEIRWPCLTGISGKCLSAKRKKKISSRVVSVTFILCSSACPKQGTFNGLMMHSALLESAVRQEAKTQRGITSTSLVGDRF